MFLSWSTRISLTMERHNSRFSGIDKESYTLSKSIFKKFFKYDKSLTGRESSAFIFSSLSLIHIFSDPEKALEALSKEGYICRKTDVLGVELDDNPGALNRLLISLLEGNINVDYLYLSFNRDSGMPIMILHVDSIYEVKNCLQAKGHCVL